ncbi:MAG: hypothetical protein LBD18_02585 [Treponema sp.]|jgi:hypothetical protein|nr:hypothetical protein [Treponema sp.]
MKKYERIREIFNSCDNNRMRDVDIQEIETGDIDADVRQFCQGKEVRCEKSSQAGGTVVYDITVDGLRQRIQYVEL